MTFTATKGTWLALTKDQRDELWTLVDTYHCETVRRWEDQLPLHERCKGWKARPSTDPHVEQAAMEGPTW